MEGYRGYTVGKKPWLRTEFVVLESDDLEDSVQNASESLRNAELSLESRQDQLEDYTSRPCGRAGQGSAG